MTDSHKSANKTVSSNNNNNNSQSKEQQQQQPVTNGEKRVRKRSTHTLFQLFKMPRRTKGRNTGVSPDAAVIGQLFDRDLDEICPDGQLPLALQNLLECLWLTGAQTDGIFRQSPSIKKCRELRDAVDAGQSSLDDAAMSAHVAAGLLKDLLRSLPNSLLDSGKYNEWMQTTECSCLSEALTAMKSLIDGLKPNQRLLLCHVIAILQRISVHQDVTRMTPLNLAVCIGPSLLWQKPESSVAAPDNEAMLLQQTSKLSLIVERLIEHYTQLFTDDVICRGSLSRQRFLTKSCSVDDSDLPTDTDGAVSQSDLDLSQSLDSPSLCSASSTTLTPPSFLVLKPQDHSQPTINLPSPVPPPRTKKRRHPPAAAMNLSSPSVPSVYDVPKEVTSFDEQSHSQYISTPDADLQTYQRPHSSLVSDDSQFESQEDLSERNPRGYSDSCEKKRSHSCYTTSSPHSNGCRWESLQSSTQVDELTLQCTLSGDQELRRRSAPVCGATSSHRVEQFDFVPRLLGRHQQLSTDSAISVSLDNEDLRLTSPNRHRLSLLDSDSVSSHKLTANSPAYCDTLTSANNYKHHQLLDDSLTDTVKDLRVQTEPCVETSRLDNIKEQQQQHQQQQHSAVNDTKVTDPSANELTCEKQCHTTRGVIITTDTTSRRSNIPRGMTLSGADRFPRALLQPTSTVFIDNLTAGDLTRSDISNQSTNLRTSEQQRDAERRKKLAALRERWSQRHEIKVHGDSSSSSSSSDEEGASGPRTLDGYSGDSDGEDGKVDDSKKINQLRDIQQRRSYNFRTRPHHQHRDISRSHSDSIQTIRSVRRQVRPVTSQHSDNCSSHRVVQLTTFGPSNETLTDLHKQQMDKHCHTATASDSHQLTYLPESVNSFTLSQSENILHAINANLTPRSGIRMQPVDTGVLSTTNPSNSNLPDMSPTSCTNQHKLNIEQLTQNPTTTTTFNHPACCSHDVQIQQLVPSSDRLAQNFEQVAQSTTQPLTLRNRDWHREIAKEYQQYDSKQKTSSTSSIVRRNSDLVKRTTTVISGSHVAKSTPLCPVRDCTWSSIANGNNQGDYELRPQKAVTSPVQRITMREPGRSMTSSVSDVTHPGAHTTLQVTDSVDDLQRHRTSVDESQHRQQNEESKQHRSYSVRWSVANIRNVFDKF
jgi:hypothetical protein